jgi:hypothetical protein
MVEDEGSHEMMWPLQDQKMHIDRSEANGSPCLETDDSMYDFE